LEELLPNIVLGALFVVALFLPLGAGILAYTRSARVPLLTIPLVLLFVPLTGSFVYFAIVDFTGTATPFWVQRVPGLIALLVVVVMIRRLERVSP
jgi:hypothetical protein